MSSGGVNFMAADNRKIDLHMHTAVSDGTDTPEELLDKVRAAGIGVFSVTDHDAVKAAAVISGLLKEGDPTFITGVEFSCRDEGGKYHILGYGFDPSSEAVNDIVSLGHSLRMKKVTDRLEALEKEHGMRFSREDTDELLSLENPGKPHIGNLMAKYGYASDKDEAIKEYINKLHIKEEYVRPETAIRGILDSGGIPVLAHPLLGSGDEIVEGEEMDARLRRLIAFGLQGVEAFYSSFDEARRNEMLSFAERYGLYVTAGSDYHGTNKKIEIGCTGLDGEGCIPDGLKRFLEDVSYCRE